MIHTDEIRRFLQKWETSQAEAYIPCRWRNFTGRNNISDCGEVLASSGVTVGTGVDLGQQSEEGLLRMGVPEALVARLRPYFGLRRKDAVVALERLPLNLSNTEREALDEAVHADYIRRAAELYARSSDVAFDALPAEAQTVVVSLFYQLGSPYGTPGYRKTWGLLCTGLWAGAARELKTGFTRYSHRRTDEGCLLDRLQGGTR